MKRCKQKPSGSTEEEQLKNEFEALVSFWVFNWRKEAAKRRIVGSEVMWIVLGKCNMKIWNVLLHYFIQWIGKITTLCCSHCASFSLIWAYLWTVLIFLIQFFFNLDVYFHILLSRDVVYYLLRCFFPSLKSFLAGQIRQRKAFLALIYLWFFKKLSLLKHIL